MSIGWETKTLGEISQINSGGTPLKSTKKFWEGGDIPWYSSGELNDVYTKDPKNCITQAGLDGSNAKLFPKGSLLVGMYDTAALKTSILDRDAAFNQAVAGILPRNGTNFKFLLYAIWHVRPEVLKLRRGVRQKNLSLAKIKSICIPCPAPAEQRRIVVILDEAFDGIATAKANSEKNLQNARALFESHLQSIFAAHGASWQRVTLATLLERGWIESHLDGNHGGDYPRKDEFIKQGVPYVSANCLDDERLDMTRAKYLSTARAALLRKGIAKNGDVLFAHNATVGPVAILHTDEQKVILGTSLTYYRCNRRHILPEYLAHYMRSFAFKLQYLQVMRQSTRNQVPITKQREFYHIIPPINEQKVIVTQLDGLFENGRRFTSIYQRKLAALDDLKQSLLHQAFSGQL